MPLVTLANNKVVNISIEIFLLPDNEYEMYIQELLSMDAGESIDNFIIPLQDKRIIDQFPDDDLLLFRDDI